MKTISKKAGVSGFGFLLYHGFYFFYSSFLSISIVVKFGMIKSFLIMFPFLIIFSFIVIKIYDRSKSDWLLIDKIKEKLCEKKPNKKIRILKKILKNGELVILAIILFWDPVVTFLYYRKNTRSPKNGTERKIFFLFILSAFLCASSKAGIISLIIPLWCYTLPYLKIIWWYLLIVT